MQCKRSKVPLLCANKLLLVWDIRVKLDYNEIILRGI